MANKIECIQAAQKINDEVYRAVLRYLKPSITDFQVANEIKRLIHKFGGDKDLSFPTLVCSGVRTALFHGPTSRTKKLKNGEVVYLDFGAKYKGFCSDMTRTVFLGKPNKKLEEIYKHVLKIQEIQIKMIKPGVAVNLIDKAGRDYLKKIGLEKNFVHSTGHGVGKKVHELPKVSVKSKTKLKAGQVITIEPGVYIPKLGGVRIEDMILVTPTGHKNLTRSPKELTII